MNPIILLLTVIFQIQGITCLAAVSTNPHVKCNCKYDAFISSMPIQGKEFLYPLKSKYRQADWYEARGYCAEHCAEMVTIHSEYENRFFVDFMKNLGVTDAVWLGSQVRNFSRFNYWSNGEPVDFKTNHTWGAPALSCLTVAPGIDQYNWSVNNCMTTNITVACQKTANTRSYIAPLCYKSMDLYFLLDGSTSIGSGSFEAAKSFIIELVRSFKVQCRTRIGILSYSYRMLKAVDLTDSLSLSAITSQILEIPFDDTMSTTSEAIYMAMMDFDYIPRSVPRNLVVLTDGDYIEASIIVSTAARRAKSKGINVFVVGIGDRVNKTELLSILDYDEDRLFTSTSIDNYEELLYPLGNAICKSKR